MIYVGSKRGIAKEILPIILKGRKKGQFYVEPFCGGCNLLSLVENPRIGSDTHYELIAMYKAGQRGWIPPEFIYEEEYERLRNGGGPDWLRGYAGFTHSFGSKYFGGYRRHTDDRVSSEFKLGIGRLSGNYLKRNVLNIAYVGRLEKQKFLKEIESLEGVEFKNCSYDKLIIPSKSIVYCDPPYNSTTGYKGGDNFNHSHFWLWAEQKAREGHSVFVSEYSAPSFAKEVWRKRKDTQLSRNGNGIRIEKLFKL